MQRKAVKRIMTEFPADTLENILKEPEIPIKQRLIEAGIGEIEAHGVRDFSLRRTAAACGVSCAAPYKHFKSKDELILAILEYYRGEWHGIQIDIINNVTSSHRDQLIEISIAYIRFLVSNPAYRTILMLGRESSDSYDKEWKERAELTGTSGERIRLYCEEQNMPHDIRVAKTFIVRSFIYGAAMMISNGELEDNEPTYTMIRKAISREFDIEFDITSNFERKRT